MGADATQPRKRLGAWDPGAPWIVNTVYQAVTDGFVIWYTSNLTTAAIQILTDSANPPTTIRTWTKNNMEGWGGSPVKKDEYWKIVNNGIVVTAIYWIPLEP